MKPATVLLLAVLLALPAYSLDVNSLLADEQNTIQVFQTAASKVVYVHRLSTVVNKRSLKSMDIQNGAGSGIIWDDKGHIVTNYHVIKGADKLAITLGKLTVRVRILGSEPRKDIAVLQITSKEALSHLKSFKPFEVVNLSDLMVGQKAIAIGNPYGLDHSLSKGIISALGRQMQGVAGVTIRNMIQTDTAINPGNSGGPLLNSAGQLIGMNTMIFSNSGSSAGVGFAVPAADISRIVTQIIQHGRVVLSGLGVQWVPEQDANRLGVSRGVLVADVLRNSPADNARIRPTHRDAWGRLVLGDVIVALNGHKVNNYDALYNLLTDIKVGEKVTVTIARGNRHVDVAMKTIDIAAV